jgi:hypothetical protein
MKKLGILLIIMSMVLLSCVRKVEKPVEEDDFLKIPEYTTESYKPTYIPSAPQSTSTSDSTYWYVVLDAEDANWHGTVSLGTPYFDFLEARKQFDGAKGKGYFEFILQISRESVDTYHKYSENK